MEFDWVEEKIDDGGGVTDTVRYAYYPLCKECDGGIHFDHDRRDYFCEKCDERYSELLHDTAVEGDE